MEKDYGFVFSDNDTEIIRCWGTSAENLKGAMKEAKKEMRVDEIILRIQILNENTQIEK